MFFINDSANINNWKSFSFFLFLFYDYGFEGGISLIFLQSFRVNVNIIQEHLFIFSLRNVFVIDFY